MFQMQTIHNLEEDITSLTQLAVIGYLDMCFNFVLRTQELSPSKMKKLCEELDSLDRLMEETEHFVCQQKEQLKHLKVSEAVFWVYEWMFLMKINQGNQGKRIDHLRKHF